MIARVWSARATGVHARAYVAHLETVVLPALRGVEGYAGARLMERASGEEVEIVVITTWDSLESVRRFAGDDLEHAVVTDEAAAILTDYDRRVRHYEIVVDERAGDT